LSSWPELTFARFPKGEPEPVENITLAYVLCLTDVAKVDVPECGMKKSRIPHVVSAERVGDAVLIEFSDRKCGLYTAALLHEVLHRAIELKNTEPEG
jgi:hypothetical protein